jgi:hypothetical protein
VSLLLDYAGMARREGVAHLTGLETVAFIIKLTPHWSGHRDVRPDPGVGNAELYCLSYDRKKPKRTNTYRVQLRTAGQFPLAVFQNFGSPASLKIKTPLFDRVGLN